MPYKSKQDYDASYIKVLNQDEIEDRFSWVKIESLADQYKRPKEFIAKGFEACRRSSVSEEYFIKYYLQKCPDTPRNRLVEEAYRDLKFETY